MPKKNNKLKVLHVVASLNVGGAERFVIDLSLAQKNLGIEPSIISLGNPKDILVSTCKSSNVPVITYSASSYVKFCLVFFALFKFDIIHVHSPHALKYIRLFLPFLNAKVIYTRHGAAPYSKGNWLKFHQKIKQYISAVTFVSQEGLNIFQGIHQWDNIASFVIDNGVLLSPINSKAVASKKLRIGSVGRMIPLKNQIGLLKALALLSEDARSNISVDFFGDGECFEQLKAFDNEYLPTTAVKFHGMVNDRELIYSSFDLLVVTSETEGLSMVIIEAMANQIPVIATDVGGNPKLVLPNQTGWLFDYDDEEQLAKIIANIVNDKTILKPLGHEALNYVATNFSIETSANKYLKLYES